MFIISSLPCFLGSLSFPQPFLDKGKLAENSAVLFASGNACLWNCSERRLQHVWNYPSAVQTHAWDGFSREKNGEPFGRLLVAFLLVWDWRISIQWHWPGLPYDVELSSSVCLIGGKNAAGVRPYDPSCCGPRVCCQFPIFLQIITSFSLVWFDGIFRYN